MSLGYTVLVLAIYLLAVMRLVRLINADTILDGMRIVIGRRARDEDRSKAERERWSTLEYFTGCPWCVGMWLSMATAILPVLIIGWPWWALFPVALAVSHLVGVCARFSVDDDIEIAEA